VKRGQAGTLAAMWQRDKKRFSLSRWRLRRRVARNQQLLDTGNGARVMSASLTTLDEPAPEAATTGHLRVW